MIRSPGTRRRCAEPVPEDVLLKLRLLGLKLIWDRNTSWMVMIYDSPAGDGSIGRTIEAADVARLGWDRTLSLLADEFCKPAQPVGWRKTTELEPNAVPIPAAAVIDEDAFRE